MTGAISIDKQGSRDERGTSPESTASTAKPSSASLSVVRLISADHAEAPASMRRTGAAMALVEHMIGDARAERFKIIPICPYVLGQYRKHPEWSDVMASASSP
jgi:predicted GNAT family acetyltransferase